MIDKLDPESAASSLRILAFALHIYIIKIKALRCIALLQVIGSYRAFFCAGRELLTDEVISDSPQVTYSSLLLQRHTRIVIA